MEQEKMDKNTVLDKKVDTLETEVGRFADVLPYWAKYLAERLLSGNTISEKNIENSYSYLLEELKLKDQTVKPIIKLSYKATNSGDYKQDLLLTKVEKVEGVNALAEDQVIEFSPNLTIIYGANGSEKSGYVRLFKKAFYSKAPETILQNVHLVSGHKPTNSNFTFTSNNTDIPLSYLQRDYAEFRQFSVFDGKGLFKQLAKKMNLSFVHPA